jgi:hypothetical protein
MRYLVSNIGMDLGGGSGSGSKIDNASIQLLV